MDKKEKERMKQWLKAWEIAGPELERMRLEDIRGTDTKLGIRLFSGLLFTALKQNPPKPTSGLIEQQALFMKLRHA